MEECARSRDAEVSCQNESETGAMLLISKIKTWAKSLERDIVALLARRSRRPRSLVCQSSGWAVAAHALSPVDLIPDFIPVLGYLDDLISCQSASCWPSASLRRN
jgi:uncharacterized membrane protein YkvA (DUF1232 family)